MYLGLAAEECFHRVGLACWQHLLLPDSPGDGRFCHLPLSRKRVWMPVPFPSSLNTPSASSEIAVIWQWLLQRRMYNKWTWRQGKMRGERGPVPTDLLVLCRLLRGWPFRDRYKEHWPDVCNSSSGSIPLPFCSCKTWKNDDYLAGKNCVDREGDTNEESIRSILDSLLGSEGKRKFRDIASSHWTHTFLQLSRLAN